MDLTNFFDLAIDLLCITNKNGYFVELNPRWSELLGYSKEELMAQPFLSFVHPEDQKKTEHEASALYEGHQSVRFENRYMKKDGSFCYLSWNAQIKGDYIYATASEITELKVKDLFSIEMQETARIGYWRVELDTQTPVWSDGTYDIHEVPRGTKVNMEEAINFYAPEARPIVKDFVEKGIHEGVAWDLELPFITAKDNHLWVRTIGKPIVDGGKVRSLAGVFQDITEIRKAQQMAKRSSKFAALGELASGIAHEINNPLAIIMGTAASLRLKEQKGLLKSEDLLTGMDKIEGTTERIANIIRSLRKYAKNEQDENFETIIVRDLIDEVIRLGEEAIRYSGVSLKIDIQEDLPALEGKATELMQVFINLINNACYATKDLEEKWVKVEATYEAPNFLFTVTDSGPGIPEEIALKLFRPFYTTKGGEGTGLGLSLTKQIVEHHNGTIEINRDSENTQFVLKIPKNH